jgi:GNAT superfamily N-acetyltransferase
LPALDELLMLAGDGQADGAVVQAQPGDADRALVRTVVERATGRVLAVRVSRHMVPTAPDMWLVAMPEPAAEPPAMTLVAFGTRHAADGTVVDAETFTAMPVRSAEQLAAVRWFVRTGQVHQIYVAPDLRRRGIGTRLLLAAGAFAVASGWPRLWSNGERTDLGEALASAGHDVLRRRAKARTRVLPPMTPGDVAADGVVDASDGEQ